jgi:beta-lysine 5,6-aminomutase alpha subunit
MADFGDEIEFKKDGFIQTRAQEVLKKSMGLLEEIEQNTLFTSLSKGVFADIKRPVDGGKGLDGVAQKDEMYFNPFIETMLEGKR